MFHSILESFQQPCPRCQQLMHVSAWKVLDCSERPDLGDQIVRGHYNHACCPACSEDVELDLPVLLYRPGQDPALIYSPSERATVQEARTQQEELLALLAARMGRRKLPGLRSRMLTVWRPLLPAALRIGAREIMHTYEAACRLAMAQGLDAARRALDSCLTVDGGELDSVLELMTVRARDQKNEAVVTILERDRALLSRCREKGIEQALESCWLELAA